VVSLRVELQVLRHYLDIEQVRHGPRLILQWNVASAIDDRLVPSMVLQPIVENAIRHGFTDPSRALTVKIAIEPAGSGLMLSVEDDGEGISNAAFDGPAERIGLGHTRARLAGLYGDQASLQLQPVSGGRGTRVVIRIPDKPRSTVA
jgi:LytS/YehU family sensor histidine kinase